MKYAWRLLTKSWGYSLLCASVVALSVGLAVFAYEIVYSQLFRPLGWPGSERWYSVQLSAKAGSLARPNVDAYTYQELLKSSRLANHLGAFTLARSEFDKGKAVVLSEGEASRPLRAAAISPKLLAATRVPLHIGRVFQETDGQTGAAPVAILSYDAWQNYFAGDRAVIGKTARIDSAPVQIVGVMPKDFLLFQDFEVWMPLKIPTLARPADSGLILTPFILADGKQNLKALRGEMQAAVDRVNRDYPDLFDAKRTVRLIPGLRTYTHPETPVIVVIAFLAIALLLLGCVNISMVFLARLLERSRELALRSALGATRGRLLRQCLLETFLIALLGLIGGWGLAVLSIRWAQAMGNFLAQTVATGRIPNLMVLRPVDLIVALLCAIGIWLLSTLVPAWRIAKQEAAVVLAGSGKGATVSRSNKSVGLLVALQVAVSALVLVICGNITLAVKKEVDKPTGMNTARVLVSTYPTSFDSRYAAPDQRLRYWSDLTAAIESRMPGAEVAFATAVPTIAAAVPAAVETDQGAERRGTQLPGVAVSDGYFQLLGLTPRAGRLFDSTDDRTSLPVAVVDEKLAARYWPGQAAVGKRVRLNPAGNGPWLTIVGVVSGVAGRPYSRERNSGVIYQSLRQATPSEFLLLTRLPTTAADNRVAIRAAAFGVDRDLPLHNLQMLDTYLAAMSLRWSGLVSVFLVLALITIMLAASGLFGLISRSVAQRTQEIGIRRALGATSWQATSMFMRQGALYLAIAIVAVGLGTAVTAGMSRAINNILDRVGPVTLGVVVLIAAVVLFASYLPSRRAVALEPGDALRYE
ncbi:MAG TPA: ABC transporter permease [Thermoanaerobaculia bacterium]|nr:ABC transporter permease [Thermoanaerobaculia bacterium]